MSHILDPKPGELAMGRVKSRESEMEARTGWSCDSFGCPVVRSEKLIELGNSWFSPKELLGSRRVYPYGAEHWKVSTGSNLAKPIKLRIRKTKYTAVRRRGLSSVRQKGNSLDLYLRSLNHS